MSGKIKVLDSARNWGEFDSRNYYLSKGIQYSFKASEINIKERQESGLGEFLRYVRKNVKEIYNKTFRVDNYGLICAMVLVDKNDLEEDIKEYLKSIYYGIIDKDICNNKSKIDKETFILISKYIINNASKEFSVQNIVDYYNLNNQDDIYRKMVYIYLEKLEQACLISRVKRYDLSLIHI